MGLFDQNYMAPHPQAKAVKAYLECFDGVEASWDAEFKRYEPVHIAEWHNGREEGYVIIFRNSKRDQLNIAFFGHRNSDNICAIAWVQSTMNPPTIDTAKFGDAYKTKWDVSHSVDYGEANKMADWIMEQLETHWKTT